MTEFTPRYVGGPLDGQDLNFEPQDPVVFIPMGSSLRFYYDREGNIKPSYQFEKYKKGSDGNYHHMGVRERRLPDDAVLIF